MTIMQGRQLSKEVRRSEVLKIFRKKPHVRKSEVAKTLGVKTSTIVNDIKELTEELKASNPQTWHLHRERMLLKLNKMMDKCENKLELCRGATSGTRWVEEWTKLFEKEAKILGIYTPDRSVVGHLDLSGAIGKDQRDAAINALILGQEKNIIDITPEHETSQSK